MDLESLTPGIVIDRYVVESFIGAGGMATVLKVRHRQLGTAHAMKVLNIASGSVRDRLVQEGRLQAALQHENVVKVTDLVTLTGGAPGLIMEFVEGPNLDELLNDKVPTLAQADHLAQGILRGVEEAHRHGLVHRDLKPANILLQPAVETWVPKVADFGIAKVLAGDGDHTGHTRTGMTMGTPNYMAPEQARDAKNIGPTADIFALGAILYELLTNQRAFEGNDILDTLNRVAEADYVPIQERKPNCPPGMMRAIEAALQVEVQDRPQTVDELRAMWLDGRPPLTTPVPFEDVKPRVFPAGPVGNATISQSLLQTQAPQASGSILVPDPTPLPMSRRTGLGVVALVAGVVVGLLLSVGALAALVALQFDNRDPRPLEAPGTEGLPPPSPVVGEPSIEVPDPVPSTPEPPTVADVPPVETPEPAPQRPPEPEPVADLPMAIEPDPDPIETPTEPEPEPVAMITPDELTAVVSPPPVPAPDPDPVPTVQPAGYDPYTAPLTGRLADTDPSKRRRGVKNLAYRGDEASRVLLGRVMRDDPDPGVRQFAWETIESLLQTDDPHLDLLQDHAGWQLANGEDNLAIKAVKVLHSRGSRPGLLVSGLRRRSVDIRIATLDAVSALPPEDRRSLRSEVELLTHVDNPRLRKKAVDVLSLMP
ncbi:MAG: protein kinase [Myxococcota bacterium]